MLLIIAIIFFVFVCVFPSLWAQYVLDQHSQPRADYPGTGGEFARHLLDFADMRHIPVEKTNMGDHYDPLEKVVRLDEKNFDGKHLTAVVVAAHEVGHALQDRDGDKLLNLRTSLARVSIYLQAIAGVFLFISPFIAYSSPRFVMLSVGFFVLLMLFRVFLQFITLPVEFDASFNKALPILDRGKYVPKSDLPAARAILNACAWTYVAAALLSIINIFRWARFMR